MKALAGVVRAGAVLAETRRYTPSDVSSFASAVGDFNPIHVDAKAGEASMFGGNVVHGMLIGSHVNAIVDANFPRGSAIVHQSLRWESPVFVGDTVRTELHVMEVKESFNDQDGCSPESSSSLPPTPCFMVKCESRIFVTNGKKLYPAAGWEEVAPGKAVCTGKLEVEMPA
jgi:3-hydroxybutyryl-CoA dehydratase